jgi:hypothetical protein
MSFQLTGKCQVYKVEDKGSLVKASIRSSEKNKKTDEWESTFVEAIFVGECKDLAKGLADKTKIEVTSSKFTSRVYNEKTYFQATIFGFTVLEGQATNAAIPTNTAIPAEFHCPKCGGDDRECDCNLPF